MYGGFVSSNYSIFYRAFGGVGGFAGFLISCFFFLFVSVC